MPRNPGPFVRKTMENLEVTRVFNGIYRIGHWSNQSQTFSKKRTFKTNFLNMPTIQNQIFLQIQKHTVVKYSVVTSLLLCCMS